MADVIRPAPLSIRQSQARKLFEEAHFIRNSKLRLALLLISKNITDPDLIARIAPELGYPELKKLERVVHAEIDKTLPERIKKFGNFLTSLTTAQKEAIEHVHLKNDYGLSQADIAKKLGISIDSLADRLRGAEKKLRAAYPEFRKKKTKKSRKKENPKGERGS
jgi:DNA-directed RNA polymerase specialized sigma24 family protein